MKYQFKYRLTQKSNLATIAKAVRALGYDMSLQQRGFNFGWLEERSFSIRREIYEQRLVLDENVAEWLNGKLEDAGLLARKDSEP